MSTLPEANLSAQLDYLTDRTFKGAVYRFHDRELCVLDWLEHDGAGEPFFCVTEVSDPYGGGRRAFPDQLTRPTEVTAKEVRAIERYIKINSDDPDRPPLHSPVFFDLIDA